ncbi:RNA-binding domain-containing protein [Roridomyces roridus]|uniref:RNA-binding domain-containing protein n=1 Tax=Roridomyces roridus TaxID=1738132 RepID=A0AAD7FNY3_9AGAR|nr:RNA-binding domain-containing protein [Roridomyces roridus]
MDLDMKTKEEEPVVDKDRNSSDREKDHDRHRSSRSRSRDRDRDRRDRRHRDKRDSGRSRHRGSGDRWEPDSKSGRSKRSRSRSRSPKRRSRRSRSSHSRSRSSRSRSRSRGANKSGEAFTRSLGGPMNAPHEEAVEFSKVSKRENRVYVGNLSYDVRYRDIIEFCRAAGEVLFAEVMVTPPVIVEFGSQEDAQRAMRELSEQALLGRPVFIREDRETESRFGASPVPGKIGAAMVGQGLHAAPPPRPPSHNHFGGGGGSPGNQLYVGNLPYQAGWQDLKDLFRQAGHVVRADIQLGQTGQPKGSGTVVFENARDAANAIKMYHGTEWYGRTLEVREDRYAGLGGSGGFRGGLRGMGFRGGMRGGGLRGGLRGGFRGGGLAHGAGGARAFSNQDIYADYSGPEHGYAAGAGEGTAVAAVGFHTGGGGYNNMAPRPVADPSQQIMVRNLPWSTANEDLVELFETTGQVELAEILFEGTRSKGSGVVQFATVNEAETAIAKFQGYLYGGRPLDVRYNDRWHTFLPTAATGGQVSGQADMM